MTAKSCMMANMAYFECIYPSVWETPRRLRFGVDSPVLAVTVDTLEDRHVMHLLRRGVSEDELRIQAETVGMSPQELTDLLTKLAPVLRSTDRPNISPSSAIQPIVVTDPHKTGERMLTFFRGLGYPTSRGARGAWQHPPVIITVDRYAYDSARLSFLLTPEAVVLPVRFTDSSVTVGPFLREDGPCGNCFNLFEKDLNPEWLRWAPQLSGRPLHIEQTVIPIVLAVLADEVINKEQRRMEPRQLILEWDAGGFFTKLTSKLPDVHEACPNHEMISDLTAG